MKINLLRKGSLKYKRIELIKRINRVILVMASGIFLLVVIFVSGRYVYLRVRVDNLKQAADQLEQTFFSRSAEVFDYVRVKQVVSAVDSIQTRRFKYKVFLTEVYQLLPAGAQIVSVDFATPGVVLVSARFDSVPDYELFLNKLSQQGQAEDFIFKGVAQKSLLRNSLRSYQANFEIEI